MRTVGKTADEGWRCVRQGDEMPQDAPKAVSWWLATLLGLAVGVTLTFLRTQRNFFIVGAIILGVVISYIGVVSIRRRSRCTAAMHPRTTLRYLLWSLYLLVLIGPVQTIYVADDPDELWWKSLALSAGLTLGIHEVDRAICAPREDESEA